MFLKFIKRLTCAAAIVGAVGVSVTMAGCTIETNHPTAQITIEFNGETYEIDYKLYRNMYPQTVRHFIELADSGFYDNTIIHNYTSTDWYGGGYSYIDSGDKSYSNNYKYATYYDTDYSSKAKAYSELFSSGALTATVFRAGTEANKENCTAENALTTLIGEFASNDHNIDNGALESQYGGLRMYYNAVTSTAKVPILTGKKQYLEHDYKYNCATSLFAIQVSSSSSLSDDDYCLFGVLKNDDATEVLEDLQDAIDDYIDSLSSSSSFTSTVSSVSVEDEMSSEEITVSYTATSMPIIIRSVEITKY